MGIIPMKAIFPGNHVLFNNHPFFTNENDLISLVLQLNKHLDKHYHFSDTRS